MEQQLLRLREELREPVAQHMNELRRRLPGSVQASDEIACLMISTKILDDEHEYDLSFWAAPDSVYTVPQLIEIEVNTLKRLQWRASVLYQHEVVVQVVSNTERGRCECCASGLKYGESG